MPINCHRFCVCDSHCHWWCHSYRCVATDAANTAAVPVVAVAAAATPACKLLDSFHQTCFAFRIGGAGIGAALESSLSQPSTNKIK